MPQRGSPNEMSSFQTGAIEGFSLGSGVLLLVFGIALIVHLRRAGGLEFSLAQMLAVPHHRAVFLTGLVISLAALFAIGFTDGVGTLVGLNTATASGLRAGLYGLGVVGILILMLNALRTREPSLEAGWNLQETGGRLSYAATPRTPAMREGRTSGRDPRTQGR